MSKLVQELLDAGLRVGVTAQSHRVIADLNPLLKGWFGYFQHAHPHIFAKLDQRVLEFVRVRTRQMDLDGIWRRAHFLGERPITEGGRHDEGDAATQLASGGRHLGPDEASPDDHHAPAAATSRRDP